MDTHNIKLILLALPSIEDILNIAEQLHCANYQGEIAAIARFPDEHDMLVEGGIDKVFNFYSEAGFGFAEESLAAYRPQSRCFSEPLRHRTLAIISRLQTQKNPA